MNEALSHEEISRRFLDSGALNFEAMGKFVTDVGPDLLQRDKGVHGVIVGTFNSLACFLTAASFERLMGNVLNARDVARGMHVERHQ